MLNNIVVLVVLLSVSVTGFHINVIKKDFIQHEGIKIGAEDIHQCLKEHERVLIFGKQGTRSKIQLVDVKHMHPKREKRSMKGLVTFQLPGNEENIQITLQQAPNIIDNSFMLLNRYENISFLVPSANNFASLHSKCFYHGINAIFDICDYKVRGSFYQNNSKYLIHPLPNRYGNSSHVIINSELSENLNSKINNFQVENIKGFNKNYYNNSYDQLMIISPSISRTKRYITSNWKVPHVLHIETAVFIDKDLFTHMSKNFPHNTEMQLIRFVLAMINGVQLLYQHPSLGYKINFVLKRLEILHSDPKELQRSSDIDIFLNNFCLWQRKYNPSSDRDILHYDHAVILTGLDLYVIGKQGKLSSQVVGLAPVAGMCTPTSSCTVNEGKHFESVFVVAHEIGHNLGMRHDSLENNCDPSLYIMSPTLGSGKTTWSKCSRDYLNAFLESSQAQCLFDRGQFRNNLDHSAEGILPGERFDADKQCMLKYGKDSIKSKGQPLQDICHDLHCQRDRYTWTSHPALEGTECGPIMFCRSGVCKHKGDILEANTITKFSNISKGYDKSNIISSIKLENFKYKYNSDKVFSWSNWDSSENCDSGCLYGESGRLREGSSGLKIYSRYCLDPKRRCKGLDKKYETCIAKQCYTIAQTTIKEFSEQICQRAKKFDSMLSGEGLQMITGTNDDACKVFCKTKTNGTKTRNWTYPDGTTCRSKKFNIDDLGYCISGRCEKFSCEDSDLNNFKIETIFCPQKSLKNETINWRNIRKSNTYNTERNIFIHKEKFFEKDLALENGDTLASNNRKLDNYRNWNLPKKLADKEHIWTVKSGCHFSCLENTKGIQVIISKLDGSKNIQLCTPSLIPCERIETTKNFANTICSRYRMKVRGLSGFGRQIGSSIQDPDRSCRVACQDEFLEHRFYLVNGEQGLFPFGTKCSDHEQRYCVNGKCLAFGSDNVALLKSYINLALFEKNTNLRTRKKRSFLYYTPVNISELITQEILDEIIRSLENRPQFTDLDASESHVLFEDPIHVDYATIT